MAGKPVADDTASLPYSLALLLELQRQKSEWTPKACADFAVVVRLWNGADH